MLYGFFFAAALVCAAGYLASRLIFRKAGFAIRAATSFGLGAGMTALLMTILGLAFNFGLPAIAVSFATMMAALLYMNIRFGPPFALPDLRRFDWKFSLIVVPFVVACLVHVALFPELYKDSAIYSEWARMLYDTGRIAFVEGGPSIGLGFASNYPSAQQLLSVFVYSLSGEDWLYQRLLSVAASLSLALLVYAWAKDVFGADRKMPYVAVVLLLSLPFTVFFARSASQYAYLTLQFSLAGYFLYEFIEHGRRNDMMFSAVFGGFAAATSYLGLFFIPVFALALLKGKITRSAIKDLVLALLLLVAIASPWYVRNAVVLGNPLWPIGGVGAYIDSNVYANSLEQLASLSRVSGFDYSSADGLASSLYRTFFTYFDYSNAAVYNGLNPALVLLALPAAVLLLFKKNTPQGRSMWIFGAWIALVFLMYAVFVNYWSRYTIVASVPVVMLAASLVGRFWKTRLARPLVTVGVVALYVSSLYLAVAWDECPAGRITDAFAVGIADQSKILETCYGSDARVWAWVNANLPADAVVATTDYRMYMYDRTTIELSGWRLRGLYYSQSVDESVLILKQNGVTHLAVTETAPEIENYLQNFELLARFGSKAVYKVV